MDGAEGEGGKGGRGKGWKKWGEGGKGKETIEFIYSAQRVSSLRFVYVYFDRRNSTRSNSNLDDSLVESHFFVVKILIVD